LSTKPATEEANESLLREADPHPNREGTIVTKAFTAEWLAAQCKLCVDDPEFQAGGAKLNRSFTVHVLPSPDKGATEEYWWGFKLPEMSKPFSSKEDAWDTDYVLEADYETWFKVNEGIEKMVPLLMGKKIMVPTGSVSYIARFVPVVERFWQLSASHTDEYDGEFTKP
jgi:hypothetical protein